MSWHPLINVHELSEGTGREFTVENRIVALFRVGDQFYALDGICAHNGGPLGKGELQGTVVTCPWHGWQFDVSTGRHCLTNHICQTQFPVRIEGDQIYVELS